MSVTNTFPKTLSSAEDITPEILGAVEDCLDWFEDERGLNTEEFIDRLCDSYGGSEWELHSYDSPAARKIMRHARALRRERA